MSYSSTRTEASTFTLTHAKQLASKVTSDLQLCSTYYGSPSESELDNYEEELTLLLHYGYVEKYEFGFQKDNKRVVSWLYTVDPSGNLTTSDDRPGKVFSKAKIDGCRYFNFLTYSQKWLGLSKSERDLVYRKIPIKRTTGSGPVDGNGYWKNDHGYYRGGCSVARQTFIPY